MWYIVVLNTCNIYTYCLCFQNVYVHILDLSSARQVWEFANNFSINNTVHVLVSDTYIPFMPFNCAFCYL